LALVVIGENRHPSDTVFACSRVRFSHIATSFDARAGCGAR
jgi:hypothetical protein